MLVTLCSIDIKWEDKAHNLNKLESLFSSFEFKPNLVVLPEMFSTGFTMNTSVAEPVDGPTVLWLKKIAAQYSFAIIASIPVIEDGKVYNRAFFILPDGTLFHYDKRHLFRMGEEQKHYTAGTEKCIVEYCGVRFALNICYDIRFPVWSRNINNEYDVLVNIANFPTSRVKVIEPLVKARAIENQSYALFVNRIGTDCECSYTASSMAVDFKGDNAGIDLSLPAAQSLMPGVQIINARLNIDALHDFRAKFPAWKDADSFEISKFL